MPKSLHSARLTLRPFTAADLPHFAALHADPAAMADLGGPISRADSRAKLTEYIDAARRHGIGRHHVSDLHGFIGYVGVRGHDADHPLGPHYEIGWRLLPRAWGHGYATKAAALALRDAFARQNIRRILAYTAPGNTRSRAVIGRLGLRRRPDLDFTEADPVLGAWHGQVWLARAADWRSPR